LIHPTLSKQSSPSFQFHTICQEAGSKLDKSSPPACDSEASVETGIDCFILKAEGDFLLYSSWFPVLGASCKDKNHFSCFIRHGFRYWVLHAKTRITFSASFVMVSGTGCIIQRQESLF
jgi:hypothetical protein